MTLRASPRAVEIEAIPGLADLYRVLGGFVGWIDQKPPAYSAVHVQGQRAYRLARWGRPVSPPARKVRVDAIDLLHYSWPKLLLRVTCGKGVYIRSLARDIGLALGTGGHLTSLRRTHIGRFDLSMAWDAQSLASHPIVQDDLIDPESIQASPR